TPQRLSGTGPRSGRTAGRSGASARGRGGSAQGAQGQADGEQYAEGHLQLPGLAEAENEVAAGLATADPAQRADRQRQGEQHQGGPGGDGDGGQRDQVGGADAALVQQPGAGLAQPHGQGDLVRAGIGLDVPQVVDDQDGAGQQSD